MTYRHFFLVSTLLVTTAAAAQPKPEDLIKYRQSAMQFMRWSVGELKVQLSMPSEHYQRARVVAAANAIAAVSATDLPALFTVESAKGEGWHETRLKPAYFDQPEESARLMTAFRREAQRLAELAATADQTQLGEQFEATFKACKSCHKAFRRKP